MHFLGQYPVHFSLHISHYSSKTEELRTETVLYTPKMKTDQSKCKMSKDFVIGG
jgi:hypothetical protein